MLSIRRGHDAWYRTFPNGLHSHSKPFILPLSSSSNVHLLLDNVGIASVPVTPDPNSASKSRGKRSCSFKATTKAARDPAHVRLNKFVRRLHDMLLTEKDSGIVEWRRGLLVLFSTDAFSKTILPKYFNTRNFKTFRRQVRYDREYDS